MHERSTAAGWIDLPERRPVVRIRPAVALIDLSPYRRATFAGSNSAAARWFSARRLLILLGLALALSLGIAARARVRGHHAAGVTANAAVAPPVRSSATVVGVATFYAGAFDGRPMADGATFNMDDPTITAANRWPLGTKLCVRRVAGGPWDTTLSPEQRDQYFGRAIEVTVADRGAFTHALDLSRGAFAELGRLDEGVIRVAVSPAPDQSAPNGCQTGATFS